MWDFHSLIKEHGPEKGDALVKKEISKIFDESDLKDDKERDDMYIYCNEVMMSKHPELRTLKQVKTNDQLK